MDSAPINAEQVNKCEIHAAELKILDKFWFSKNYSRFLHLKKFQQIYLQKHHHQRLTLTKAHQSPARARNLLQTQLQIDVKENRKKFRM